MSAQCAEGVHVSHVRRRKRYTPEFKAEAVRLVQTSDRPITEIAAHLGVTAKSLHDWIKELRPDPPERLTADERSELLQLRRENATLRMERDILKKATAFFARESK
jgi:transposase